MTGGWEGVACRQFQRSFLQTCSDRLHMPGNLEFISPPFLFSVLVIQINSNEISRGKPPLLVGGLQLPVAKSNPMAFSLNEGQTTPWNSPDFNIWKNESEALSLTDIQPELRFWLEGNFPWICEFSSHISSLWASKGQQIRNFTVWDFYLWRIIRVVLVSQLQQLYGDLNKQRLFVCAHCGST